MTRMQTIALAFLALVAGGGAFLVGQGTGRATCVSPEAATCPARLGPDCNDCDALATCLGLSADQARSVAEADAGFRRQAADLRSDLEKQRKALARLLEEPASSDETLMQQVERVIAAHDALERRVARHVLAIRKHLTPPQAKRLMGLAAESVRCAGKPRQCCATPG